MLHRTVHDYPSDLLRKVANTSGVKEGRWIDGKLRPVDELLSGFCLCNLVRRIQP
jgi:hypothetical protein